MLRSHAQSTCPRLRAGDDGSLPTQIWNLPQVDEVGLGVRARRALRALPTCSDPRRYAAFHNLGLSGCDELSPLTMADVRNRKLLNQNLPPVGKALMAGAQSFYSRSWRGSSLHSHLEAYDCIAADYLYNRYNELANTTGQKSAWL